MKILNTLMLLLKERIAFEDNWIPAILDGKPISSNCFASLIFKLD